MAEGGGFSESNVDGSDIVYEFVCTPCEGDGSRLEAFNFCQACDQFLCDTCTKYHQRLQKSHQLQPVGSMKKTQRRTATSKQQAVAKCHIHPDRDIEMYCGTHDMVYCLLCIAQKHRSCENVEEVQDGVHKPDESKLQQVAADINFSYDALTKMKRSKSDKLKEVEKMNADLLKDIDRLREKMNDHLDQLEREIKAELEEIVCKIERNIHNDIDAADNLLTTVSDRKSDLVSYDSDKHMFIAEKLGRKVVSDVNAFIRHAKFNNSSDIKFVPNTSLYDSIKMTDSLGNIWTFGDKCLYVYSTSGTFVKKIETDSLGQKIFGLSQPCSIAVNKDATKIYVTTLGDNSVVVFNNNGDIIRKLRDKRLDRPCGICVTDDDIVFVVGHWSQNTLMFDRDGNSIGELVSSKDQLAFPYSLCYDSTNCRLHGGFYVSDTIQVFELCEQI